MLRRVTMQRLEWRGDFRFEGIDSHGTPVPIDADFVAGAKPSELLTISLAACTAYDVVNILRKQRQDLTALTATIESDQDAEAPWRFRRIAVRFTARGRVDATKAAKALALSEQKYCAVSATLRDAVELDFTIEVADEK
jgi:putative redox protein